MKVIQTGDMVGVAFNLHRGLREQGIEASLAVMPKADNIFVSKAPGVDIIRLPGRVLTQAALIAKLLGRYRNYDIFHAHSLYNIPLMLLGRLTVSHFHGSDLRETASSGSICGRLLRMAMRRTKKIIVSTPDLVQHVKKFGIPDEKVVFLPNPIDTRKFKPGTTSVEFPNEGTIKLFHPSRFQKIKGNEKLLLAYRELQDKYPLSLHLVRDRTYSPELERALKMVDDLKLKRVHFLPWLEHSKMADYYNAADIVLGQFSHYMIDLVSLEAMSCAKPVITSLIAGDRNYPEPPPACQGLSVDDIISSLTFLAENRDLWGKIGRKNRDWVKRHHSLPLVTGRLLEIYRELMEVP